MGDNAPRGHDQQPVLEACPLCAGSGHQVLARFPELTWVRCDCGLVYKRSAIPEAQQGYGDDYFGSGDGGRRYDRRRRRRIAKSRHQILDLLNHVEPGPLLDIGCSLGYTLEAARQLGLEATGCDLSAHAVACCREAGFAAETGRLDALPFEDGRFALVTMKHVLEHTPDPRAALAEVRRVLRPGGGVFIAVPHEGYRRARADPTAYGFYRPDRHGTEHFVYYTPATLSKLLSRCGFMALAVHPALRHRRASPAIQLAQLAFAPLRAAAQLAAGRLALRKEFWLVAGRRD